MTSSPDLYAELDVPRDADAETIKRAYRKKAQSAHPDKAKNDPKAGEKFHAIVVAYQVLSDPRRREQYDRTGEADDRAGSNELQQELGEMVLQLIEQTEDVDHTNIVDELERHIRKTQEEMRAAVKQGGKKVAKLEKAKKRVLRKKPGVNFFALVIQNHIEKTKGGIASIEARIVHGDEMLAYLAEYRYDAEILMGKDILAAFAESHGSGIWPR